MEDSTTTDAMSRQLEEVCIHRLECRLCGLQFPFPILFADLFIHPFQQKYRELFNAFCIQYNNAAKLCFSKTVESLCLDMTRAFREIDRTVEGPGAWIAEADSIISSAMQEAERRTKLWTVNDNRRISYLQPLLDHGAWFKVRMVSWEWRFLPPLILVYVFDAYYCMISVYHMQLY